MSAVILERIRCEIVAAGGAIPFPRFMEIALYTPGDGYYEGARVGRSGDFYTSVSVGGLFGEMLAFDAAPRLERMAAPTWVEAGAHDGRLAADVLGWMQANRPGLHGRMKYRIVEPSARRREWQRATLAAHAGVVDWVEDLDALGAFTGEFVANELLDAFPIERLGWDSAARRWYRWGVCLKEGGFGWCRMEEAAGFDSPVAGLPEALLEVLPEGYTVEWSPGAEAWWERLAGLLAEGRLVTADYGYPADDRFRPERTRGTLRGYRQHRLVDDVLADPGSVDLTAHVDFGRIAEAGERAGLATLGLETQRRHLTWILGRTLEGGSGFGEWTASRVRQFQTLTHPQHLGHSFRVLVQARSVPE